MPIVRLGSTSTSEEFKYYDFGDYSVEVLLGNVQYTEAPDMPSVMILIEQLAIWMVESGKSLPISIEINFDDPDGNIVKVLNGA